MRSYLATVPVEFACPAGRVYQALRDVSRWSLWNQGMVGVGTSELLREGLVFDTESVLIGDYRNKARIRVVRMQENEEIEIVNEASLISYRVLYRIISSSPTECELICTIRFEMHNFVLDLARPAIESMARSRLQTDMLTLRKLIEAE